MTTVRVSVLATLHAELSAEEDPLECHDIIDDIERDALEELHVHLVIHYDPVVLDDAEWNEMNAMVEEIVRDLNAKLTIHDFRVVRSSRQTKLMLIWQCRTPCASSTKI